jgi:hypothetical protein
MRAIADILRMIGGALATIVTLPFRLVARLFGGASRGGPRPPPPPRITPTGPRAVATRRTTGTPPAARPAVSRTCHNALRHR